MRESGLWNKAKQVVAAAGLVIAAERGLDAAPKKQDSIPLVEKSSAKVQDFRGKGPLLPDSRPSLDAVQEENLEAGAGGELAPQADYDTDEAQTKRMEHAMHLSDLIMNKYTSTLTVLCIDGGEDCMVSLQEELSGVAEGDRSVLKYRFDDSGNCYVYGIGGEDDTAEGLLIKSGDSQGEEVLSLIDSAMRLREERERIFNEAEKSLEE